MQLQIMAGARHFQVQPAERRATVATDKTGGIQPCQRIALCLQHRQAYQCLNAGDEYLAVIQPVFVIQRECLLHGASSLLLETGTCGT
ncbi:MAG: hypothetical protein EKK59_05990 [Neisseriaceae bacterium]|nr:MAG: hypothetical protein EKK59_05990 [Neisseriaceae bacterium]